MTKIVKFPLYLKVSLIIVSLYFLTSILYIGQFVLLPIIFATMLAIAINPMFNFLMKLRLSRILAIAIISVIILLLSAGLLVLIASQASHLSDTWPQLTLKFQLLMNQTATWLAGFLEVSEGDVNTWLDKLRSELIISGKALVGPTISTMGSFITSVVLTFIYVLMILYYQPRLLSFIHQLFKASNNRVGELMAQSKNIIQNYLGGLILQFFIISILNIIGLIILGIDYAFILGFSVALLNIIPYIGGLIAVFIFMVVALLTKDPIYVIYVIILYSFIQFIDNNYIVTKIIGSKVKLNALITAIAVIAGAALWGIPGMFLSIPLAAVVKMICDNSDSLKSWGYLMGDSEDTTTK